MMWTELGVCPQDSTIATRASACMLSLADGNSYFAFMSFRNGSSNGTTPSDRTDVYTFFLEKLLFEWTLALAYKCLRINRSRYAFPVRTVGSKFASFWATGFSCMYAIQQTGFCLYRSETKNRKCVHLPTHVAFLCTLRLTNKNSVRCMMTPRKGGLSFSNFTVKQRAECA